MRLYSYTVCVISFAISYILAHADAANDASFNVNEARKFLELHNEARREANVQPLTWDDGLAKAVQSAVDTCAWNKEFYTPVAMIYHGNSHNDRTPQHAMETANREKKFVVNGETNQCCFGTATRCCRYAKVVSSEFTSLGCGQKVCNYTVGRFVFPDVYVAVCVYIRP